MYFHEKIYVVDEILIEWSNSVGNNIEKQNFLCSVTETEEISYNTETTKNSDDNENEINKSKEDKNSYKKRRRSR